MTGVHDVETLETALVWIGIPFVAGMKGAEPNGRIDAHGTQLLVATLA